VLQFIENLGQFQLLLDIINIRDNCPKSGQIWSKNLAGAGLDWVCQEGPDAGPAGAKIRYIPRKYMFKKQKDNHKTNKFAIGKKYMQKHTNNPKV